MTESINTRKLCVSFGGQDILHDVDFTAGAQGITAIVGRSGSGKTTLLRQFNRLNEIFAGYRASGEVNARLGGDMVKIMSDLPFPLPQLRRRIGMVFQTPDVLPASIARNMLLPLRVVAQLTAREAQRKMEAALIQANLWTEVKDRLNYPAERLSGGQKQRLCLARALALDPDILLLDEPTASLDIMATEAIESLLLKTARRLPLIIVTHNPAQAARLASHVSLMVQGRLIAGFSRGEFDESMIMALLQEAEAG